MIKPRLILCNGITEETFTDNIEERYILELNTDESSQTRNVYIQLENLTKVFQEHLSPRLQDLLEIAAYVYTADCATSRGSQWTDSHSTEAWERDFEFVIAVRDVDFWSKNEVCNLLVRILNFLSNDKYKFTFLPLTSDRPKQLYLQFSDHIDWPFYDVDRVLMFSGGLDSLAGAISTADTGENLVLVSHRSAAVMDKRQRQLFTQLQSQYQSRMIHIPVWINKDRKFGREHTQRTRSFLYVALGTIVANSIRAKGVRFFENGIVSLNLPVADEVLRARASRTTHPQILHLFSDLMKLLLERDFIVDNPFLFMTKTEVVRKIAELSSAPLIELTSSCAHTIFTSKTQWHCGTCSQCIDRRIATLAAQVSDYDPAYDYVSDVFTGKRKVGYEQNMAVDYIRHGLELHRMGEGEIAERFGLEIPRAIRYESDRSAAAEQLIAMHKRHGETVAKVVQSELSNHSTEIVLGELTTTSLLALVAGQNHVKSSWIRLSNRILEMLTRGLPLACESVKPQNEPHLQEICDGILQAQRNDLIREFPFMKWSASATKPDWSHEESQLWVELKYVREKRNIRNITEDIAADITKYGDNNRRTLFVVYDPHHLVGDERKFAEDIEAHANMRVGFVR